MVIAMTKAPVDSGGHVAIDLFPAPIFIVEQLVHGPKTFVSTKLDEVPT